MPEEEPPESDESDSAQPTLPPSNELPASTSSDDATRSRFGHLWTVLRVARLVSTIAFGTLCIVTIGMWYRSYSCIDQIVVTPLPEKQVHIDAASGRLGFRFVYSSSSSFFMRDSPPRWFRWRTHEGRDRNSLEEKRQIRWFLLNFYSPQLTALVIAHWIIFVVTALLALAPWCSRRFTVRTTLVATFLVAMVLAIIFHVDKNYG